jgi:hypothetical protein
MQPDRCNHPGGQHAILHQRILRRKVCHTNRHFSREANFLNCYKICFAKATLNSPQYIMIEVFVQKQVQHGITRAASESRRRF